MQDVYFTLAEWRVLPGREEEFIKAWEQLGAAFSKTAKPPRWGRLLQSETAPGLFYSFGEWRAAEDRQVTLGDPGAQEALNRLRALCQSGTPGMYKQVAEAVLEK